VETLRLEAQRCVSRKAAGGTCGAGGVEPVTPSTTTSGTTSTPTTTPSTTP